MRIVQIGLYPVSSKCIQGGVEASVYGLAQELSKVHEVHAFDLPRINGECGVEKDGLVIVHRYRNPGKKQFQVAGMVKVIAEEITSLRPDVCHIHGTGLFSWLMFRRLRRESMKVMTTVHGLVLIEKRNQLKKRFSLKCLSQYVYQGWVEKHFLSLLKIAVVDTEYVRDMVNRYPIGKKPEMVVIPQGISEDYYSMHCSSDSNVILSVGAFGERKGHLLTLQAFEKLRREGVCARLVIVGTIATPSYYESMLRFINLSDFKNDIIVIPNIAYEELKMIYASSHVFALHSEEESQGIVFAEAMAVGLPVVATRVGGVPFVVKDGESGLLSEYAEVNAFSKSIKKLFLDKQLWESMSQRAKETAMAYRWATIVDRITDLYQRL